MNAIGIFAGRGDVIVAMFLTLIIGFWIGWKIRSVIAFLKDRQQAK